MKDGHVFYGLNEAARHLKKGWFYISYRGALYPIWWDITRDSQDYVIFVPGRTKREKPLPSFQRRTYADEISANVICLCDPTLFFAKDLGIAWFVGDKNAHYAVGVGNLLKAYLHQFQDARTLIYASSAGGIPAYHMANIIGTGCTLYLNNVQTNASAYVEKYYMQMVSAAFRNMPIGEFEQRYASRVSICNVERCFELVVTQNIADDFHLKNHFEPFVRADKLINSRSAVFITYHDEASGHNVLSKEIELKVVEKLLRREPLENIFPSQKYV